MRYTGENTSNTYITIWSLSITQGSQFCQEKHKPTKEINTNYRYQISGKQTKIYKI